jgi:RNA polymerase sigma factor (TIGR02999 family)
VSSHRRGARGAAFEPAGLVHEAYFKLVDPARVTWQDRSHFLGVAARAMRQVLVDFARQRLAAKRGGGQRPATLEEAQAAVEADAGWVVALNEALGRLAEVEERLVRVVECRFFAGLTEDETAETLGVSRRTVQRDWLRARAWLAEELRS